MKRIVYKFTVPGAPKGKARPRMMRTGHTYTPEGTAVYENLVKVSFMNEHPDVVPFDGPVTASVAAYFPIPKSWSKKKKALAELNWIHPMGKPDIDNILKIVFDGLNGVAFTDDAHIVRLKDCSKEYSVQPRVDIILEFEVNNESN